MQHLERDHVWETADLVLLHLNQGDTDSNNKGDGYSHIRINIAVSNHLSICEKYGILYIYDERILVFEVYRKRKYILFLIFSDIFNFKPENILATI